MCSKGISVTAFIRSECISQAGIGTLNLCPMESANGLIDSFRSVKNGKQWPTISVSSVLRARPKASPTRSILEPLYPDKETMGNKAGAEALKSWHCGTLQLAWFMTKITSCPVYDCPLSYLQSLKCMWMDRRFNSGWKIFDETQRRSQGHWSCLIQPRSPKWQLI